MLLRTERRTRTSVSSILRMMLIAPWGASGCLSEARVALAHRWRIEWYEQRGGEVQRGREEALRYSVRSMQQQQQQGQADHDRDELHGGNGIERVHDGL